MEKNPVPPPYSGPAVNHGYEGTSPPYPGPQVPYPTPPTQYGMNQYGVNQYVLNQPAQVVVVQPLTDVPAQVQCRHCHAHVVTETKYEIGAFAWLLFVFFFLFLCWPCACIPFCVDSCKDVEHTCPNCHNTVHRYKRM